MQNLDIHRSQRIQTFVNINRYFVSQSQLLDLFCEGFFLSVMECWYTGGVQETAVENSEKVWRQITAALTQLCRNFGHFF